MNIFLKVWHHMLLDPPSPCHKLSHLGPLPLKRDVLYWRPPKYLHPFVRLSLPHTTWVPGLGLALVSTDLW